MFGKLSFFKFQHLATNGTSKFERLSPGGNFSTRILATLLIAVVQGKSLQSLDYFQRILAGKNTARFWFSCYPSSIYSSLSISHILQREFFNFGPFGQLRAVRERPLMTSDDFGRFLTYLPTYVRFGPILPDLPI